MKNRALVLMLLLAVWGCATPESGLVIQARKDQIVKQMKENLANIASHNIDARERAEIERLTEKTKYEIIKTAAQQGGKLSAGASLGFLMGYKDNLRKIVVAINVEREMLGKAKVDYETYKRLSAEIADYLAKIGRITPEQLKAFGEGLMSSAGGLGLGDPGKERNSLLEKRLKDMLKDN